MCEQLQDTLVKFFTAVSANEYLVCDNISLVWVIIVIRNGRNDNNSSIYSGT